MPTGTRALPRRNIMLNLHALWPQSRTNGPGCAWFCGSRAVPWGARVAARLAFLSDTRREIERLPLGSAILAPLDALIAGCYVPDPASDPWAARLCQPNHPSPDQRFPEEIVLTH
jgi:hypothetical protein